MLISSTHATQIYLLVLRFFLSTTINLSYTLHKGKGGTQPDTSGLFLNIISQAQNLTDPYLNRKSYKPVGHLDA